MPSSNEVGVAIDPGTIGKNGKRGGESGGVVQIVNRNKIGIRSYFWSI